MKPSELRIGNIYLSTKFKFHVFCTMADIAEIYHIAEGSVPDEEHISSVFEPILLTEEWLRKFGFEKDYDQPFEEFSYFLKVREDNIEKEIEAITIHISPNMEFYNGIYSQIIKSVHQLQNLMFALTGKELEIK